MDGIDDGLPVHFHASPHPAPVYLPRFDQGNFRLLHQGQDDPVVASLDRKFLARLHVGKPDAVIVINGHNLHTGKLPLKKRALKDTIGRPRQAK